MIPFDVPVENPKLLRRAVRWARKNRDDIPCLSALAPRESVTELTRIAKTWQKAGLGSVIESLEEGHRSVFSLKDAALMRVDAAEEAKLTTRLRSIPRSDWIAFLALVVSIVAMFKESK